MNKCEQLHETVVRDIVDIITSAKDFDQIKWINNKNNTGSIAKRASNLVLVFPVIVSNSLNINTAMIISKAIERKCCSLLQILFSSMQISDADNLQDYVKQFHTNLDLKTGMDLDEFFGIMDDLVDEGAVIVNKEMYEAIKEDMHNINYYLDTDFNPNSINDYKVANNAFGEATVMLETKKGNTTTNYYGDGVRPSDPLHPNAKDQNDYFVHQLLDNDIKKANELMPTTMIVNFISRDEGVNDVIRMSGVIGVKAKMYPVDSMDICNRLASKVKDKNGLFNLVRASTREISFFKDFLFCIDKAKIDALSQSRRGSSNKIWKVLERRANKSKIRRLLNMKNDATAITTLCITQDEAEYLRKTEYIDVEDPKVIGSIMDAYNLMGFVIADDAMEICKFMFDTGDYEFEVLTYDNLEREQKDNTKKILNLMSKIR